MVLTELCRRDRPTLLRLIDVFENPVSALGSYPDGILHQAFWDLSVSALPVLYDQSIEWELRHRLVRSFEILFRDFFAVRCTSTLGHCSEPGSDLNIVCYMWWDFDCWCAGSAPLARNPLDAAFIEAMSAILEIDHLACQESALHGLGHWHRAHSAAVEQIIDEFVRRKTHLPPALSAYAQSARCGCVL